MSKLTESEYEEYIQLLRAWVDAEKALEGAEDEVNPEARGRALEAHAAVQGFRLRYGLGEAAMEPVAEGKR